MDDPKNQAFEDQRARDKASGDKGGDGQPVNSGLTKEEKGDQRNDSDGDSGDGE